MSTKPGSMPVSALRIPLNVQSINKPASLPLPKDCRNCVFGLLNTIVLMFCSLLLNNFYRHDGDRLTTFHYFIVLASELSNARISGFARAFINNSISTSSEEKLT